MTGFAIIFMEDHQAVGMALLTRCDIRDLIVEDKMIGGDMTVIAIDIDSANPFSNDGIIGKDMTLFAGDLALVRMLDLNITVMTGGAPGSSHHGLIVLGRVGYHRLLMAIRTVDRQGECLIRIRQQSKQRQ
ncbi:MAG: hypothetical protein A2511_15085 [Deltaproteobacteria bacterium RIFOXYD12_FULL_50_9]|nr:MAG: hypothetical protein A2511_15085 [Deltaproteobacteria bacterium RIFOXYD12_FULL_50_9]